MRVVFLGTPSFAVPALQKLIEHSYEICGVFTQPDRPSGRGQKLQASPIKTLALKYGLQVYQPDRIRNDENRGIFEKLCPDFVITTAYGQILPLWILQSARLATVNIHASLLPKYRGASPIARAILNGDEFTGITTMMMEESLDSGPILLQQSVEIPFTITTGELTETLSVVGANLLLQTLAGLKNGSIQPSIQDESQVSWAPRITKEMAPISWEKRSLDIHNQIRAMNPWPVASTRFQGEPIFLWRSCPGNDPCGSRQKPGAFIALSDSGILIECGNGSILEILEVQRPGKSRVSGRDFANGARLHAGEFIFQ
jgi:methionyl-tRNA formyltransferase